MEKKQNKNAGFTLIELLISVTILALALVPLFQTIVMSGRLNAKSRDVLKGTDLGQNLMERMTADTFESIEAQMNNPANGFHLLSSQEFSPLPVWRTVSPELQHLDDELLYASAGGLERAPDLQSIQSSRLR